MIVAGNKNSKQGPKAPAPGPAASAPRSVDTKAFGRHQGTSAQASERALDKLVL
jgi:hypothetical protein